MKATVLLMVLCVTTSPLFAQDGLTPLKNTVIADACKDDEYLLQLFCLGQVPENNNVEPVKVLINHAYVVGYSEVRRNPLWAIYKASGLSGEPSVGDRSEFFPRDLRTVSRVHGQTFGNDLDRGHMVPNSAIAKQYGSLAQMETFLMTNMCPQHKHLNRGPWMRLEKWITELAEEREHIFVICGPIFGDQPKIVSRASDRQIQIPEKFYMILVDTDREFSLNFESGNLPTVRILSYIFPQDIGQGDDFKDRDKFAASVDEIEEATKLDFFAGAEAIAREHGSQRWKNLEKKKVMQHWKLDNE